MGLDPLSAIVPARVKVLIFPFGRVRQSRFSTFVARLQQEHVVRLGDVSPDGRPHRSKTLSMFDNLVTMLIADAIPSDVLAIGFPDRLGPLRPFNLLPTVIALSFSPF